MLKFIAAFVITKLIAPSPDAPFREPQLAASHGVVAIAYGSGANIYVATSIDNGQHFAKAVKVGGAPVLPLSRHRGPRIAILDGAIVVTAVAGQRGAAETHAHGLSSDGDLLAWRSLDGGITWSKPVKINDVASAPREG